MVEIFDITSDYSHAEIDDSPKLLRARKNTEKSFRFQHDFPQFMRITTWIKIPFLLETFVIS